MTDIDVDRAALFSAQCASKIISRAIRSKWLIEGLIEQEPSYQKCFLYFFTRERQLSPSQEALETIAGCHTDRICSFLERVTGKIPGNESAVDKENRNTCDQMVRHRNILSSMETKLNDLMSLRVPTDAEMQVYLQDPHAVPQKPAHPASRQFRG